MEITVDISMYPLADEYIEPIKAFISRLAKRDGIRAEFGALSTTISGEYSVIMNLLNGELKQAFEDAPNSVFVLKIVHTACKG